MTEIYDNLRVTHVINNQIHITCPKCTKTTKVNLQNKSSLVGKFIIGYRCQCGHKGKIKLEKRAFYRKSTRLRGKIERYGEFLGSILIKDLSRSGIKFQTYPHAKLQIGDHLELEFKLDDKEQTLIRQKGIIKNSNANQYGIEFTKDCYRECDRRLGFYLLR